MRINKLTVENYKGFNATQKITLEPGINIITGQNNSGKTSLLEALSLRFASKPHKSSVTVPTTQSPINSQSTVKAEVTLSIEEVKQIVFTKSELRLPQLVDIEAQALNESNIFEVYFYEEVNLNATFINGSLTASTFQNLKRRITNTGNYWHFQFDPISKSIRFTSRPVGSDSSMDLIAMAQDRTYSFKAERFNISVSPNNANTELSNDARNLPEVLDQLHSNTSRFEKYNNKVRLVFPQIFRITPISIANNQVQLKVWMEDPINERIDLSIPLNECGTGLSQVMSILYVVMNANFPRIIIIDEPNSFLHPGASRKLIEILKEYTQHQFIITTHSTSTLASAQPKTIHLLKQQGTETIIESIDITDTDNQQIYLAEIGAKLSDVFGADNVLWVEGKTEEICFPMIIEKTPGLSLMGTVIISVINTGDFIKKKNRELVFSIYQRLTSAKGLVPKALGFIFDSEKLTDQEKKGIGRESKGLVKFIPRRMFENYLLNTDAIYSVIKENLPGTTIDKKKIEEWLTKNKWSSKYIDAIYSKDQSESRWNNHVDGAKLLSDLFVSITEKKLEFDKIKHSVALCRWILENTPESLSELRELLAQFLKAR